MLDSLVRYSWVRYATLAATLLASAPLYAQTPPAGGGAYYIDPAKRRERQERREREAREAAAAATPTPAPLPSSTPPILPVECNTAEECFQRGTKVYQEKDFDRAAEFFKRSYNLAPRQRSRSILLYNTAIAYEKAGDAVKSVHYYELYLHEMPDAKEQEEIGRKMPGLRLFAEADRLQEAGKHREAVKLYREAYALLSDQDTLAAITADLELSEQQLRSPAELSAAAGPVRRPASAAPPYLQPSASGAQPAPRYLQPSQPSPPETKGGKGVAWTLLVGGSVGIGLGILAAGSKTCMSDAGTGYQEECKPNVMTYTGYMMIAGGAGMGILGLWGLLE